MVPFLTEAHLDKSVEYAFFGTANMHLYVEIIHIYPGSTFFFETPSRTPVYLAFLLFLCELSGQSPDYAR